MDLSGRKSINKAVFMWVAAALLLLIMAAPALSTIFAASGSVNTKAIVKNAVTSAKIKDKTIKNADIASGAAIAAIKINRVGLNADQLDGKHASDFVAKNGDTMTGPLTAADFNYGGPRTRYLSISAISFQPVWSSQVWNSQNRDLKATGSSGEFVASANLPDGAIVTELRYTVFDNSPLLGVGAYLYRRSDAGPVDLISATTLSVDSGSFQTQPGAVSPDFATIDNANYSYFVSLFVNSAAGADIRANRVRIKYTVTSPNF